MNLGKALNILEADFKPLGLLGGLHFVVAAAHALFDIGATSLLVAHLGAEVLPQVYVGSALLLIVTGGFLIPFIDRLDRAKLFRATLVVFATLLIASYYLGGLAPELSYRGLYLLCYLMKSLLFLQFWLIAGEVCELRQAKRLFPILLGFSLAGGLTASVAASFLPQWIPTEDLLLIAGMLLILGLVPSQRISRLYRSELQPLPLRTKVRLSDTWRQLRSDLATSLGSPLLRNLSLCFFLFALLAQVLDFLMGKAAGLRFVDPSGAVNPQSLTSFYAALNAGVIGTGALVQFLIANRVISSIGVTRGQIVSPLAMIAGFGSIGVALAITGNGLGSAFFFTVLASRAIQKVLRISIYRSSTDLIFNPIPSERRGRAKAFKETIIEPSGVLAGGLLLMVSGLFDIKVLVIGSFVASGVFLVMSFRLKAHYLESLVHVLREKSRFRYAFPTRLMSHAKHGAEGTGTVSDLERALDTQEVSVRLLAVEVAAELREPAAGPVLVRRFRQETDPKVRATMIAALGKLLRRRAESLTALEPSLEDEDPRVRANGIEALAQIGITESSVFLPPFAGDPEPRIRANTAVAFSKLDPDAGGQKGREILVEMSGSEEQSVQLSGLFGLGEMGDYESIETLEKALGHHQTSVRRRALMSLARSGRRRAIDRLIQFLEEGNGATRHMATRAIESCGESAIDPLVLALWSTDVDARRFIVRALGHIGSPKAIQALIHILSLEAEEAYYDLVRLEQISDLPQTSGVRLLAESLSQRVEQAKANTLRVLYFVYGNRRGMRLILSNLNHSEPYVRASAIEALEVRVDPSLIEGVLPLFEHSNLKIVAEHGSSYFQLPSKKPLEVLIEMAGDRSRWLRACSLYALGQVGDEAALPLLERRVNDPYELARLNAIEAIGNLAGAAGLTLLERIRNESGGRVREYSETSLRRIRARIAQPTG